MKPFRSTARYPAASHRQRESTDCSPRRDNGLAFGGTQSSTYDADGRLTTLSYSGEGASLSETLTYYGDGNVDTETLVSGGNTIATRYMSQGTDDNVTSILDQYANGSTMAQYDYSFNTLNELTQSVEIGTTTNYSYDSAGQLTGAGTQTYSYNAEGDPNGSGDATATDNEVTSYVDLDTGDSWSYSYDNVGNRTQAIDTSTSTTWNYSYDNVNHLTQATEIISGTTMLTLDYGYDAFGNMIQETELQNNTTTITRYVVDGWNPANQGGEGLSNFNYWAVVNGSNGLETREIMSVGTQAGAEATPLVRIDETGAGDTGVYWTMTNRQGSVTEVIDDSTDTVVDQIQYDAWGNVLSQTGSGAGNTLGHYAWDGYDYDAAAKLYLDRARVYDPSSQDWLTQDPMGYDAGDSNRVESLSCARLLDFAGNCGNSWL